VGGLLTGSQIPANFNKRCVKATGESIEVNVQISCVWSGGAPHFLVCYVRPRRELPPALAVGAMRSCVRVMTSDDSEVSFSSGASSPSEQIGVNHAMEAGVNEHFSPVESMHAMSV
jgi:hypothetical protein